jgi:hypothetical protein
MSAKLTITQVALHRCGMAHYVLVDALGPCGGAREFTVWFDRKGTMRNASRTAPDGFFYPRPEDIPPDIAAAARQAFDADHDT